MSGSLHLISAVSCDWVFTTVLKGMHHSSRETDLPVYSDTFALERDVPEIMPVQNYLRLAVS